MLDAPTSAGGNIHVVYLKNAEAVKVAETLRAIAETGKIESAKLDLAHGAGASLMVQLFERYGLVDVARVDRKSTRLNSSHT